MSGGPSRFVVAFSMEVSDGLLLSSLPAELISVTEVKLKDSYLWQPVQTYVTISKHFMVQASGIRFQASINDCNTVMQQLFYHVSKIACWEDTFFFLFWKRNLVKSDLVLCTGSGT